MVKNTLPATRISNPPDCGEGNEVLGVALYNVYRKQSVPFTLGELFSTVHYESVIMGGDFNAHHPSLNPNNRKVNPAGTQIISLLEVTLVTEPQATHMQGGTPDLTLVSTDLYPNIQWKLHPTLTSDPFAVNIILKDAAPEHPPLPPLRWKVKKIN